jgi:hypothetical protein
MCLDLKKFSFKHKARKDIIVYKELLSYEKDGETIYVTPYQHVEVCLYETYNSDLIREYNSIHRGLHSFVNPLDVFKNARYVTKTLLIKDENNKYATYDVKPVLVECVIPKGSYYYKGTFDYNNKFKSIASDTLHYKRIIGFN